MRLSAIVLGFILMSVPALAVDNGIDDLSANELIKAKDRIEECRGLQSPTANIPGPSVGDCVQFFIRKGDLAEYRNDLYSAIILFGEAIRINNRPSYTEAYDRRGNALIGQGRLKEAISDFDTAISREPSDSRAFGYRGK
jgi:tetratricopeptide (TPR) repeat protein